MDNVFIERLWRSLKYECVYLHAFETGSELRAGLTKWIGYYNANRPHSGLGGKTRNEAYGVGRIDEIGGLTITRPSLTKPSNCPTGWGHLTFLTFKRLPWSDLRAD
jgi:putative transposase